MKAYASLPAGYREILSVDLQKDKKKALLLNGAALLMTIILLPIGHCFVPVSELGKVFVTGDFSGTMLRLLVLLGGMLAYIVLHELTHAAAMKALGGKQVQFGFTGLYAYAGSAEDWFDRNAYICIALAPVAVWGLIFTVLLILVPRSWFWIIWLLQIINITGAAGDFYVSFLASRRPSRLLVRDTGVAMTFWLDE